MAAPGAAASTAAAEEASSQNRMLVIPFVSRAMSASSLLALIGISN
jgi:hypothetical protein